MKRKKSKIQDLRSKIFGSRKPLLLGIFFLIAIVPAAIYLTRNPGEVLADSVLSLNEGYGTSVNDGAGSASGTITGATWKQSNLCYRDRCLYFDGSDWISFGDEATYDYAAATDFTIQFWFRHGPASAAEVIVQKYATDASDGGYRIQMESDGDISFGIDDDNVSFPEDSVTSTTADYDDSRWHHVAAVKDGTTGIYLYIDGVLIDSDVAISANGTLVNDETFYIGDSNGADDGDEFIGFLDEFVVFTSVARTAPEIAADMLGSTAVRGRTAQFGDNSFAFLSDGLMGYWALDEASYNGTSNEVIDASGNSRHLTAEDITIGNGDGNTPPTTEEGKFGNSAIFGGSPDDDTLGGSDTGLPATTADRTMCAWVKTSTAGVNIVSYGTDSNYQNSIIKVSAGGVFGFDIYNDEVTTTGTITSGTWRHVCATLQNSTEVKLYIDGQLDTVGSPANTPNTTLSGNFHISGTSVNQWDPFVGNADEVRIYNRALSDAEIADMYEWSASPILHFTFDENTGTSTVFDSSTNLNTSNMVGGFAPNNWVPGKFGSALDFVGSNEYILVNFQGGAPTYVQAIETTWNADTTPRDTASFDVLADDVLVAIASKENNVGGENVLGVSGGSLTWTVQQEVSENQYSDIKIWSTTVDSDKSMTASFTCSGSNCEGSGSGYFGGAIYIFRDSDGLGASSDGFGSGAAPTVNITTTVANSAVVVASTDWDVDATANTWLTNAGSFTEVNDEYVSGHYRVYGGYHPDSGSISTYSVGMSAPSPQKYTIAALEVEGMAANTNPIDGSSVKTVAFWAKPDSTTESIMDLDTTHTIDISSGTVQANNFSSPTIYVDGVVSTTFPDTEWHHVAITTATGIDPTNFFLGRIGTSFYDGALDDLRVYDYVRTQGQIVEDMNGGHPIGGSPIGSQVAYWRFDELSGATAYDGTPNANNLTLTSAAATTSGKINAAWNGNGIEFMSRADDADFDFAASDQMTISGWFRSDSASNPGATEYIVNKSASSAGYAIYVNTSGEIVFGIDDDATFDPDAEAGDTAANNDYYDGEWHHFAAVKNGTTGMYLYIDGVLEEANTSISGVGTLVNSASLFVGDSEGTNDGDELNGDIDELKVYRAAMTADQVLIDMNAGSQVALGGVLGTKEAADVIDGDGGDPVFYYKFDENTGTSSVSDSSGNQNTLNMNGSMTTGDWVPGIFGSALDFDGTDDDVSKTTSNLIDTNTMTLMAWIYPRTGGASNLGRIISLDDTGTSGTTDSPSFLLNDNGIDSVDNGLRFEFDFNTQNGNWNSAANVITLNAWQHVAVTYDNTDANNDPIFYVNGRLVATQDSLQSIGTADNMNGEIYIGNRADQTREFNGRMDEVKMYDYVMTPAQIAYQYNRGEPVGWWRFDDGGTGTGITQYDASGNGNNATSADGDATFDCTVTGKFSTGCSFDGSDDYVSVADTDDLSFNVTSGTDDGPFSISMWVMYDTLASGRELIGKYAGVGNEYVLGHAAASPQNLYFVLTDNSAGASIGRYALSSYLSVGTSTWHHLVVTYDGSESTAGIDIIIDGIARDSADYTAGGTYVAMENGLSALTIGQASDWGGTNFDGKIDDVRLYPYVLSSTQISKIRQLGAVRFE